MTLSDNPEVPITQPDAKELTANAQLWQDFICPLRQADCPCQQTCDEDGSPLPDPDQVPAAAWEAWTQPAKDLLYRLVSNRRPELEQAGVATGQLFKSGQAAFHPDYFEFHTDSSGVEYWYATLTLKPGEQATEQFPEWEASVKQLCSWLFDPIQSEMSRLSFQLRDPVFAYTKESQDSAPVDWKATLAVAPAYIPQNQPIVDLIEAARTELDEKDPYYQLLQEGPNSSPLFKQAVNYATQCVLQAWLIHSGRQPPAKPGLDPPAADQAMSFCYAAASTAFEAVRLWYFTWIEASPFGSEYKDTADILRQAAGQFSDNDPKFLKLLETAFARYTDNKSALPIGRRVLAEADDLLEYKDIPTDENGIPIPAI